MECLCQNSVCVNMPTVQMKPLWFLNQRIRQFVGIVAETGRADLREERASLRNRFADVVGRLSGAVSVEDVADEAVPCIGRHAIVDAFIRQLA